ncbi:hypothetical protein G3I42_30945, partial [Streptomyces sp. SID11385]|nr:hypothetical protein [Streptomyces sp. SID11385]
SAARSAFAWRNRPPPPVAERAEPAPSDFNDFVPGVEAPRPPPCAPRWVGTREPPPRPEDVDGLREPSGDRALLVRAVCP